MKLLHLAAVIYVACAYGQPVPGPGGSDPAPRSAEVSAGRTVTFRLDAPKATDVVVNGNWPGGRGLAMAKDTSGIWTVTTPPLDPEIWTYTFSVNGSSMLDPGNHRVVRDGTRFMNAVLIPGPGSELYEIGTAPHGTVSAVWYPSPELKKDRRMLVYTPPGYDGSRTRYPVMYLFHGGGGDEEAWRDLGSANAIMDNLIARGNAKPMIVVMPNANWNQTSVGEAAPAAGRGRPAAGVPGGGLDYARAEKEIADGIVPFIEKHYRTIANRENRAIAGLSMGGGISINVGLKRLDLFSRVAQFSSGMFGGVTGYAPFDVEKLSPGFLKDPVATNRKLRLLYFSCGSDDPRMPFQSKTAGELRNAKIDLLFKEYPGGHEWRVWRNSLADLARLLFTSR